MGLIGHGAIGKAVADQLRSGAVAGVVLAGVFTRRQDCPDRVTSIPALIHASDVVVEAAGHAALAEFGPEVTRRNVDLLVVSAGALADEGLLRRLRREDGGRVLVSTGAIGGLDLLRAANLHRALDEVTLTTTKPSAVLEQPWMADDLLERLRTSDDAVEVFFGSAREAAGAFPQSANVAATLGLATLGLDATTVRVIGDPAACGPHHVIRAHGPTGTYGITIENRPSESNPRTSSITPYAVVRALADRQGSFVVGL